MPANLEKLLVATDWKRSVFIPVSKKWNGKECSNYHTIALILHASKDILRRRQWHPTPVLLPGKSHGRRSLEGCSPGGCWELDMTERLHFYFSLSCIGEGNGNPLQCSCQENPRDGGAWWAAVYGITQSRTWLKWLSSRYYFLAAKTWTSYFHFSEPQLFHLLSGNMPLPLEMI